MYLVPCYTHAPWFVVTGEIHDRGAYLSTTIDMVQGDQRSTGNPEPSAAPRRGSEFWSPRKSPHETSLLPRRIVPCSKGFDLSAIWYAKQRREFNCMTSTRHSATSSSTFAQCLPATDLGGRFRAWFALGRNTHDQEQPSAPPLDRRGFTSRSSSRLRTAHGHRRC
jgi:hypothetical protein